MSDAWSGLVRAVELAEGRFSLHAVEAADLSVAAELARRLSLHFEVHLDRLSGAAAAAHDAQAPAGSNVWILAPEDASETAAASGWRVLFRRLNRIRNHLQRSFPHALLVVGPPWLHRLAWEEAGDLWSGRIGPYRLAAAPFGVWLVALSGVAAPAEGLAADVMRLTGLFQQAGAQVAWLLDAAVRAITPAVEGVRVEAASVEGMRRFLNEIEQFQGERRLWLGAGGEREALGDEVLLTLEAGRGPVTLTGLVRQLDRVAAAAPKPLVAFLDVAPDASLREKPGSRLLLALAGGEGFTDAVCAAIEARDSARATLARLAGAGAHVHSADEVDVALVPGPVDEFALLRAWLSTHHGRLRTVLGAEVGHEVYVELAVDPEDRASDESAGAVGRGRERLVHERLLRRATLDELLAHSPGARFAVLGEPGSGKSTMARHIAWRHAQVAQGPVVLCLTAGDLARGHPFDVTVAELSAAEGFRPLPGLVDALHRAAQDGRLWLLLDGLDEVAAADVERVRDTIIHLARSFPRMALVVLSRAIGYRALPAFQSLQVQPLDQAAQVELLARHQVPEPAATLARIEAIDALRPLTGVPLLLSFIALVARERPELPRSRAEVYAGALTHFFTRGRSDALPLADAAAARLVLAHLALALQAVGGTAWPEATLTDVLEGLEAGQLAEGVPEIFKQIHAFPKARLAIKRQYNADSPGSFLKRVAQATGVLGPYDGEGKPWRFLHKTLHDALCAEHLSTLSDEVLAGLVAELAKDQKGQRERKEQDALARWSEALAQTIALRPAPLALLDAFGRVSEALLLRCAPEVDGVPPAELVARVVATRRWDGEHLLALARRWRDEPAGLAAIRALVKPLKPQENYADLETVARVHYALSEARALGDEAAFFREAHLPPANHQAIAAWVPVPPEGVPPTFRMGSPEGLGYVSERPAHDVTLTPFELGQYPVTVAEFRKLAPYHGDPKQGRHPVTEVSWYVARLFAHWAGGRLPREAEWEYACRAGNEGLWCFGDDQEKLKEYAWFDENARRSTHPVGGLKPNAWGLYDVHGNVWEWCGDWLGDYPSAPQHDPKGPPGGVFRVLRGGAWWNDAERCRSAFRDWTHPAGRDDVIGFRVLRPPS